MYVLQVLVLRLLVQLGRCFTGIGIEFEIVNFRFFKATMPVDTGLKGSRVSIYNAATGRKSSIAGPGSYLMANGIAGNSSHMD